MVGAKSPKPSSSVGSHFTGCVSHISSLTRGMGRNQVRVFPICVLFMWPTAVCLPSGADVHKSSRHVDNDFIIFVVRNFSWISYLCRSTNSNINRCMICKISFIDKSFLTNKRILETAKCTEPTKFDVLKYYRNPRFYIRCIRILLLVIVVAYIP